MNRKTTPAFNVAAQRQDPQVFDYAREIAQAWQDFPGIRDKVIFLDLRQSPMLVYPGPEEEKAALQKKVSSHGYLPRLIAEYIAKQSSCCLPGTDGERYLLLYTDKHATDILSKTATVAQELAFVFDHELGHAVAPDGTHYAANDSVPECIADAYATIRHFQRFGTDSNALDALVAGRAYYMIFKKDRWDHFTSPVIAEILERRHEIDWDKLSPQETVQMAHDFALKYAMERTTLLDLHDCFDRYQGRNADIRAGDDTYLRTLAQHVLSRDFGNMTKAGVDALHYCLDGNLRGLSFDDEYWQKIKTAVAEKHKALSATKYLLVDPEAEMPMTSIHTSGRPPSWGRGR